MKPGPHRATASDQVPVTVFSPLLKNMYRTTAVLLMILKGCPLSTARFTTILSGLLPRVVPVATKACKPVDASRKTMVQ